MNDDGEDLKSEKFAENVTKTLRGPGKALLSLIASSGISIIPTQIA